jgi:hypothetical protein
MYVSRLAASTIMALGLGVGAAAVVGPSAASPAATAPVNTSPPTIGGTRQQGQKLSASTGSWTGDATISYAFAWQRCSSSGSSCGDISGATSTTYTPGSSDVGKTIRIVVTASNPVGRASAASSPTGTIAAAGSVPSATKQPNPHGTAQVGQTVSVDNGSWSGTAPISYAYQWQRCSSNGSCSNLGVATKSSYVPVTGDVGYRLRAIVTAKNSIGSASIGSNVTAAVIPAPAAPANTSKPTVSAPSATVGSTVTGSVGSWSSAQSVSYSFSWYRCDSSGNQCGTIPGASGQTYMLASSDAGSTVEFVVRASNATGSTTVASAPTPLVTNDPPGAVKLANGKVSIPASSVVLPDHLVISAVRFSRYPLRSRSAFTARVHITDARGYVVRDALVHAIGIPYGWIRNAPEVTTSDYGYVAVMLHPTKHLPLKKGDALVVFIRSRKPGSSSQAGESAHRLVQVALAPPRR